MYKLVRDKLPELDPSMAVTPAPENERAEWLLSKLEEEVQEIYTVETREELTEELGDVWEAFKSLVSALGLNIAEVIEAARKKKRVKGGFDKLLLWDDE